MQSIQILTKEIILLVQSLICIPSFSKEEDKTALEISRFLRESQIAYQRKGNNIWCHNRFFDPDKPTILLNSHHDTVKPNSGYTRDPFLSAIEEDKLYGLGSNDAGGSLVSLLAAFRYFNDKKDLKYNICYAATAEEEISGKIGRAHV